MYELKLTTLDSELISSVTFNVEAKEMRIIFNNGDSYVYYGVPIDVYHGLLESDSKDNYFNRYIRGRWAAITS